MGYSPEIRADLVRRLYELKTQLGKPMTEIVDDILRAHLDGSQRSEGEDGRMTVPHEVIVTHQFDATATMTKVEVERNSRGYTWKIVVHDAQDEKALERARTLNAKLEMQYGRRDE